MKKRVVGVRDGCCLFVVVVEFRWVMGIWDEVLVVLGSGYIKINEAVR